MKNNIKYQNVWMLVCRHTNISKIIPWGYNSFIPYPLHQWLRMHVYSKSIIFYHFDNFSQAHVCNSESYNRIKFQRHKYSLSYPQTLYPTMLPDAILKKIGSHLIT